MFHGIQNRSVVDKQNIKNGESQHITKEKYYKQETKNRKNET